MQSFFALLEKRVDECSSLLCVGLDPHVEDLQAPTARAAAEFCLRLVKATSECAAAFKPNAAFFESFGPDGWRALKTVIDAIHAESRRLGSHIAVILDAKRGDIASTAEAYARSAFQVLEVDAITLSPYLGQDSIQPFVRHPRQGAFLLCKTSNPGSVDVQDLMIANDGTPEPLHLHIARLAADWNTQDNVGLVVGATYPDTLAAVRAVAPALWFLVPGVGAQAGDLAAAVGAGLRADSRGLLVNISRGISRAADPHRAALEFRDTIDQVRGRNAAGATSAAGSAAPTLADALLDAGCVQFGDFTLKSGLKSPIYFDLRRLVSRPSLLRRVGWAYLDILKQLSFDRIAAVPYAAIPIATSAALQGNLPMIYPRKEAKAYGTRAEIEGEFKSGETAVLLDDLATTGGSKFEVIDKLKAAGLLIRDVVVLIDRQSGAREALQASGYVMHAVLTISELLDHWERTGKVPADRIQATRRFLDANRSS